MKILIRKRDCNEYCHISVNFEIYKLSRIYIGHFHTSGLCKDYFVLYMKDRDAFDYDLYKEEDIIL